ncbi:MAG: DciA family protein [Pseudomonadota bacterium]|nr:DciA family protein [Pseudomonadota bacterium]
MYMPRALSTSIDQVARRAAGKDWTLYATLLAHWPEIVGPDYARVTTPVKVSFPHQPNEARRSGGTLCVRLPKGLAMEFTFKTDLIRQRVNAYFGYDAIARVTLDPVYQMPTARNKAPVADPHAIEQIRASTQLIEDETLRQALQSFGEAVATGQAANVTKSQP